MCGIAGIFNLDGAPVNLNEVRAITRSLAHRGPDGEGIHVEGPLGLGHRRLAILDLSDHGAQPMSCAGDRLWVTYNGEIFNFVELRRELERAGWRFSTDTDTEVIGAAYAQWRADCVLRFNGMWAFAIWDVARQELFLSRDHFGIKPLHYVADANRFVFASELKAFLHLARFTARENEEVVRRSLLSPYTLESVEDTLIVGVRRLFPGHNMLVSASGIRTWRWWRTLDHIPAVPRSLGAQSEAFRELFLDACRLRMRSDVPIATCLSGGLDSSSVLCGLAAIRRQSQGAGYERLAEDSQRAFVATFPGTPWDERRFAEAAVRFADAVPRYTPVSAEIAVEDLHRYAYDIETLSGALKFPLWCIYRELRRDGVPVSIDGHGGDELLAGYLFHLTKALRGVSLTRRPLRTLDLVRTQRGLYGSGGTNDFYGRAPSTASLLITSDPVLRFARRGVNGIRRRARLAASRRAGVPQTTSRDWLEPWTEEVDVLGAERTAIEALGPLNGHLYIEFHYSVLPNILVNFDRCSMAHGVEVRMPFMDWRLVCFAFGLSESSKLGGGYTKRVLREAMRGLLPEEVRTRKSKIGFTSPMQDWFNGSLGNVVLGQVRSEEFADSSFWNGVAIREFVEERERARAWTAADCARVWPFVQTHLWRQSFFANTPPLKREVTGS